MQEELYSCGNSDLRNSRKPSFGDDINVAFISKQSVTWILNNLIYVINFIQ